VGKAAVVRDRGDTIYPALDSPDHLLWSPPETRGGFGAGHSDVAGEQEQGR